MYYFKLFKNHYDESKYSYITLDEYINRIKNPSPSYVEVVTYLRKTKLTDEEFYKRTKLSFPCVQPAKGCIFNIYNEHYEVFNPVYAIDVEGKGTLENLLDLAGEHIIMYHKSIGGQEYDYVCFLIGPWTDNTSDAYKKYARLVQSFTNVSTNKGQTYSTKKRAMSYDPDIFVNFKAKPLMIYACEDNTTKLEINNSNTCQNVEYHKNTVASMIDYLVENNIDITKNYYDWISICFAFLSIFPKDVAREYFLKVSSVYSNYNRTECEKKFELLSESFDPDYKITINTFYYHFNNSKNNSHDEK